MSEAGDYDILANVSGTNGTGSFVLYLDDTRIGDEIVAPVTADYDTYVEASGGNVTLTAGTHELKLEITNDWVNIDWVKFTKISPNKIVSNLASNLNQQFNGKYTVYDLSGTQIGIIQLDKANLHIAKQKISDLTQEKGIFLLINSQRNVLVNIQK